MNYNKVNKGFLIFFLIILLAFSYIHQVSYSDSYIQRPNLESQNGLVERANGDNLSIDSGYNHKFADEYTILPLGSTWNKAPGDWWDTDWEYRVNITITETAGIDKVDWPVDVYLVFDPPAFKYSIRVIRVDSSSFTEIPYQPWNITYSDPPINTYIKSATITFPVTVSANSVAKYQIYWSITHKDLPTYTKKIAVLKDSGFNGTIYTFESVLGWEAVVPADKGGRVMNITLPNGETIGHKWIHFGVTKDPSITYNGYHGSADTSNIDFSERFIEEEKDPLTESFMGVIFATYVVKGVPIRDPATGDFALVDYRLRIYEWGFIVSEVLYNISTTGAGTYYLGGWVFDQDDRGPATFDYVKLDNLEIRVERNLLYGMGSTSAVFDKFRIYNGIGYPYYVVLRAYLTQGSHTLYVRDLYNPNNVYGDDPWAKVFDLSGSLLNETYDINSLELSFTADSNGYYYIMIGAWDDDSPSGLGYGDGVARFTVSVGSFSTTIYLSAVNTNSELSWAEYVNDLSALPSAAAFHLDSINVASDAAGITYDVNVNWNPSSSDIDVVIFDELGNILSYDTTTNYPIEISFTPASAGIYTLLVIQYSGTTTEEEYWVRKFDTMVRYPSSSIALVDIENPRGIGVVKLGTNLPPEIASSSLMWVNFENWPSPSYTYWALNISFPTVPRDPIKYNYSLIIFNPSGSTPSDRFSSFNNLKSLITNKLSYSLASVEKFKITLKIKVVDNDDQPISGANVSLVNASTLELVYSGFSNETGWVVFEVLRVSYIINTTIVSLFTYFNASVDVNYTLTQYSTHSDTIEIKLKDVVRVQIRALDNTTSHTHIQEAIMVLENNSDPTMWNKTKTNLTGWVDFYIHTGTWKIAFNATGSWDYIALYSDSTLNNLVAGPGYNVTYSFTSGVILYLVDGNITSPPVPTKLYLFNTLTHYDVYWMDEITISVNLTELENDTMIDGTVHWEAIGPEGDRVLNGIATQVATGSFKFVVNTTKLPAGEVYSIVINADPSPIASRKVLKPTPLTVTIKVKERPLDPTTTFSPGLEVYWSESLTATVTLSDGLDPNILISQATVIVKVSHPAGTFIIGPFNETSAGNYKGDLSSVVRSLNAGSYTLIVEIIRGNYSEEEILFTLKILERPTSLQVPSYIEIPWTNSYNIVIEYIDQRTSSDITIANVTFLLVDPETSEIVLDGQLSYSSGSWTTTLDLSSVSEGTYALVVFAGKKNYQNITATTTFVIRLHLTSATASTYEISLYYMQNVTVNVTYFDEDVNSFISGATVTARIIGTGLSFVLTEVEVGVYELNFNTTEINSLGVYVIEIVLQKEHMETRAITITLNIEAIPTSANADKASDTKEWGENFTLTVNYTRSLTGEKIDATNHTFAIYLNDVVVYRDDAIEVVKGTYRINLNVSEIGLGVFKIVVFLEARFHVNQTVIITLEVIEISTYAYTDKDSITVIWGEEANLTVYYNGSKTAMGILGANITVYVNSSETGEVVKKLSITERDDGIYIVKVDTTLRVGSYIISIFISKQYYVPQNLYLGFVIDPIPTLLTSSVTNVTLYWNESVTIEFKYLSTVGKEFVGIANALIEFNITDATGNVVGDEKTGLTDTNGEFEITFTADETFPEGSYTLLVYASKVNHLNRSIIVKINVLKRPLSAVISDEKIDVVWGDIASVTITITDRVLGTPLSGVNISLSNNLNGSLEITRYVKGKVVITLDSTKLNTTIEEGMEIFVYLSKNHYTEATLGFWIYVRPTSLDVKIYGPTSVQLNPVLGGSSKYRIAISDKSRGGKPVVNATVNLVVVVGNESHSIEAQPKEDEPGYYEAVVDWQKLPLFTPGQTYTITVEVSGVKVDGREVPSSVMSISVMGTVSTNVDYVGGSTKIPGVGYVPNILFYPFVLSMAVIGSVVAYRVITYLRLPIEVRELNKLISDIEKGVYEYEVVNRDEMIREVILEDLSP